MKKTLAKNKVAGLLTSVVCLWAQQCGAGSLTSGPWEITADKISRFTKPETIVAEGNVVLRRTEDQSATPLTIKADWLSYNLDDGVIHGKGHLSLRSTEQDVDATEAILDMNDETATLTDATLFVPANNLHFSGQEVDKTGPISYHFRNGDFTTCKIENGKTVPWRFHSAEADVQLEKVVVLKHTVLRVKDLPMLYVPYLPLPANTKRKTGFLLPEISQSELSGSGLIAPYFMDLSPSSDLTLYPGYLSKRGVVAGAEFRYVDDLDSRATFGGTYIHDKTADSPGNDYKSDDYLRTEHQRYWVRGKLDHDFGNALLAKIDVDLASDRDYLQEMGKVATTFADSDREFVRDYHRGLTEETIPFRTSQAQLTKSWSSSFLGGQLVGINDLTDDHSQPSQVNALPAVVYSGVFELEKLPLSFSWDSGYVNYWREQGVGEERLDLHPRLTAPLPLGRFIEGTVSSGLQETAYRINAQGPERFGWQFEDDQNRTAWDFNANIATTLARDFATDLGPVSRLNHTIRPEIDYDYVAVDREDKLPGLDQVDLLESRHFITYGVNNYFRIAGKDQLFDRYLGYLKITQAYNFQEARRDPTSPDEATHPFSDINLDLNLYPLPSWQTRYETAYSVYGEGVTQYDFYSRYYAASGDIVGLDYRYAKNSEINQLNAELLTRLTDTIYIEGDLMQSLDNNSITSAGFGLIYHRQCWAVKLLTEKSADDKRIALMFSLIGLGQELGFGFAGDQSGGFGLDTAGRSSTRFDRIR